MLLFLLAFIPCPSLSISRGNSGARRPGYLFQHWHPARALPLGAKAAFAVETTGVTRKEGAAAVGGMNPFTSLFVHSNINPRRAVACRGCVWKILALTVEGGEKEGKKRERRRNQHEKKGAYKRKRRIHLAQNRPAPHLNTIQILFLAMWTHTMQQKERRHNAKALILTEPRIFVFLCHRNRNGQKWTLDSVKGMRVEHKIK